MKTLLILLSMGFVLPGITQTREDTLIFKVLNQYRVAHHLHQLTSDTGIYIEAKDIYLYQGDDSITANWALGNNTKVLAGIAGTYFTECFIFDGEIDSATAPFFTNIFLKDIDKDAGESSLFNNPSAIHGACYFGRKPIYFSYQEWFLTLIIGISY